MKAKNCPSSPYWPPSNPGPMMTRTRQGQKQIPISKRQILGMIVLLALAFPAIAEENKKESGGFGGLFNRLTKTEDKKEAPKAEEEKKSGFFGGLVNRAREIGEETLDRGKQGLTDLMDSSTEANAKMEAMLAYLDQKLAGREPAFTEAQIQAHAAKLTPLVEELNARKFDASPKVKAVGTMQMVHVLARDLVPQFEKRLPETPKAMIYLRAYLSASLFAPSLMGKYGVEDHTVYLMPQNISAVIEAVGIAPGLEEEILQIVIAHELTHGLQDQEVGLADATANVESPDAMQAFNATIEGHAVFIQNAAAKRLGFDAAAKAASDLLMAEMEEDPWLIDRVAMADAVLWEEIYLGGERFMAHQHQRGGIEAIWKIMKNPPSRTSMITRPESYSPNSTPLPDYQERFAFVPKAAGQEDWKHLAMPMGDFQVQSCLATLPRDQRQHIMRELREAAVVLMLDPTSLGAGMELALFEFNSEAGAGQMVKAMEELNRQNMAEMRAAALVKLKASAVHDYKGASGAEGSALRFQTDSFLLGESTSTVVQCRKGNLVVQLSCDGSALEEEQMDALIRQGMDALLR